MYALGIDLGTTFSAAAVWRDGRAQICTLGTHAAAVPSVVLVRAGGEVLVGEAAARRALVEPDRVAREFKRRLGDVTPLMLGGTAYPAEDLTAALLKALVAAAVEQEGGEPARVCVSHPANWGPFKIDLLRRAVHIAGIRVPVTFTTEPEAAAVSYARQERLAPGQTVAVYDLGGGTFDSAVLRRTDAGFVILGQPEGIERLGGIDIDAAVFAHVGRTIGEPLAVLDEDDSAAVAAVSRLRAECVAAKEALSTDTDTTIPVLLPGYAGEVRLTRAELEELIRPSLYDSIEALKRALRSAAVAPEALAAVLLVGGSSRIPLVGQLVGAELGRPVAVDTHPKHAIALGAAWLASGTAVPGTVAPAPAALPAPPRSPAAGTAAAEGVPDVVTGPDVGSPVLSAPADRSAPRPPAPGGVQILRPAGAAEAPFGQFVPPRTPVSLPGRPAAPAGDPDDEERRGEGRAALLGGFLGAEAGVVGIAAFEQGQAAGAGSSSVTASGASGAGTASGAGGAGPAVPHAVAHQVNPAVHGSAHQVNPAVHGPAHHAGAPAHHAGPVSQPPAPAAPPSSGPPPQVPAPPSLPDVDAAGVPDAGPPDAPRPWGSPAHAPRSFAGTGGGAVRALAVRRPVVMGALSIAGATLVGAGLYLAFSPRPNATVVTTAADGSSSTSSSAHVVPTVEATSVTATRQHGVRQGAQALPAPAQGAPRPGARDAGQSAPPAAQQPSGPGQASSPPSRGSAPSGAPSAGTSPPAATAVVAVGYSGRHSGVVTSADGRISCPDTCSATYPVGTVVVLHAGGEDIDGWSGCPAATGATCRVRAGDGNAPSVRYAARFWVTVGYSHRIEGSVSSTDGAISCPGDCSATYPSGASVTLVASGQEVDHWTGCESSSGRSCQVTAGDGNSPRVYFAVPPTTTTTSPSTTTSTTTTSSTTRTTTTTTSPTTTSSSRLPSRPVTYSDVSILPAPLDDHPVIR